MASRWSAEERERYVSAAEQGSVAAQIWLGWAYWEGKFLDVDLRASRFWLERAASNDHGEAKYRYALFCRANGDGDLSLIYLAEAINHECAAAAYDLGNCYYSGVMVHRDRARAISLWQRAAKAGHLLSEIQLIKSDLQSASWFRKPLVWLQLIPITVRIAHQFWKNSNHPSVLGAPA